MNPRELLRIQFLLQLVHRHAHEKGVRPDVQPNVVGRRIEPVHLFRIHEQVAVVVAHGEALQVSAADGVRRIMPVERSTRLEELEQDAVFLLELLLGREDPACAVECLVKAPFGQWLQ